VLLLEAVALAPRWPVADRRRGCGPDRVARRPGPCAVPQRHPRHGSQCWTAPRSSKGWHVRRPPAEGAGRGGGRRRFSDPHATRHVIATIHSL
jgi:hypothetical protein